VKTTLVQGVGLGLRWEFADQLVAERPALDFIEISPENYMGRGGFATALLSRAAAAYPIVTHGLTMSMGGTDPLGQAYLEDLRAFLRDVQSPWHSDHLCFGLVDQRVLHDLLPLSFTKATVRRTADRIKQAQDAIGVPLAVENISYYMHPGHAEMDEATFVGEVCEAADCGLMLDVNNAYVNSINHGFDVDGWMRKAPLHRVVQMHIAGHEYWDDELGGEGAQLIVDTHGADVCDPVVALMERVLKITGPVPVLLERDQAIPPLNELLREVAALKAAWLRGTAGHRADVSMPASPKVVAHG